MPAADAFLFAGTLWLMMAVAAEVVVLTVSAPESAPTNLDSLPAEVLRAALLLLPLSGGAALSWYLHGRSWSWSNVVGGVLGALAGAIASGILLFGLAQIARTLDTDPSDTPWEFIYLLAAAALLAVAAPLLESLVDIVSLRRATPVLDVARGVSFVTALGLALGVAPLLGAAYGSQIGQAGLLIVPVGLACAFAVLGADAASTLFERRGARQPRSA